MDITRHGRRRRRIALVIPVCLLGLACSSRQPAGSADMVPPSAPPATPPSAARRPTGPPVVPSPMTAQPDRVLTLGQSVEARPVFCHLFGDTAVGPANTVLIFGGIHGSEPTSAGVARELVQHLRRTPDAYRGRCVAVVPEANPDGLARKIRSNKNLIDLNRNFPAANWKKTRKNWAHGGDAPASQPETRLLIDLIDRLKPARVVAVHSMDAPCNNYDGPAAALAKLMSVRNGYPVKSSIGYPTPGSFGSWAGGDRQIPVITLELPNAGTTPTSWAKNRDALVAFIRADPAELRAAEVAAAAANAGDGR